MAGSSNEQELRRISLELHKLTLHRQQLMNRLQLLSLLKEFKQKAGYPKEVDEPAEKDERGSIEDELKKLSEKKMSLLALQETLEGSVTGDTNTCQNTIPDSDEIFVVENPPSYPAPQAILDINQLRRHPAQTRCPYCEQYITTEVRTVIGNTAWHLCLMCSLLCCIAGCCLIPFCISSLKDVQHKCPKCRSHIHTCTKM